MTTSSRESRGADAVKGVMTWSACGPTIARRRVTGVDFHLTLGSSPAFPTDTSEGVFDEEKSLFSYKKMLGHTYSIDTCSSFMTWLWSTVINLIFTKTSPSNKTLIGEIFQASIYVNPGAQTQENVPSPSMHCPPFSHPWFWQSLIFSSQYSPKKLRSLWEGLNSLSSPWKPSSHSQ